MSGGALDYFCYKIEEHVGDFKDRELDDLVKDLADLFYEREWFLSGDTCEGKWVEARDNFKAKWFTPLSRQNRIEEYLEDIKDELLKSFGLSDKYCKNCQSWTEEKDSDYGFCDLTEGCMLHKYESCKKFCKETQ